MKDILSFLPFGKAGHRPLHRPSAVLLGSLAALSAGAALMAWKSPKFAGAADAFQQAKSGGKFQWEQAAALGEFWAGIACAGLFLVLLLTLRFWGALTADDRRCGPPGLRSGPLIALPVLALIFVSGYLLRSSTAQRSLWWDEAWGAKEAALGEWREKDGQMKFREASWGQAMWYFNKPTNHPPLSVAGRFTHDKFGDAKPGDVDEWAYRMPVVFGSLIAACIIAVLTGRHAGSLAGLCAGLMVAVHPWTVRYGVDARAYGLLLPLTALGMFLVLRMTRDDAGDRLRWWWLFGLNQFLLVWSHPLAIAAAAGLFIAAVVLVRRSWLPGRRTAPMARLFAVNGIAAGLWLLAFLPCLLQVLRWGERNQDGNVLDGGYLWRTITQITFGMEPALGQSGAADGILTLASFAGGGWLASAAVACVFFLFLTGFLRLRRISPDLFTVVAALLGAAAVLCLFISLSGFFFYHRFIVWIAVPLAVCLGAVAARQDRKVLLSLSAGVLLAAWAMASFSLFRDRPLSPLRDAAEFLKEEQKKRPIRAIAFGHGTDMAQIYFPALTNIRADSKAALQQALDEAKTTQQPLYVLLDHEELNRINLPDGAALLLDPAVFETVAAWPAADPERYLRVFRAKDQPPQLPPPPSGA